MDNQGRPNAEERDDLRAFAQRVEKQILASGNKATMELLICRILSNKKNPAVAATMAHKWVEWRYGKATDNINFTGSITHEHINLSQLSDEQLAEADKLIDSALSATGSEG